MEYSWCVETSDISQIMLHSMWISYKKLIINFVNNAQQNVV